MEYFQPSSKILMLHFKITSCVHVTHSQSQTYPVISLNELKTANKNPKMGKNSLREERTEVVNHSLMLERFCNKGLGNVLYI